MPETISTALRQLVFERAEGRCEYCLLSHLLEERGWPVYNLPSAVSK